MISGKFAKQLKELEAQRFRLASQAEGFRLQAFNTIESLAPPVARVDMAISLLRYAHKHWVLAGALMALAGFVVSRRIGMRGLGQLALRLGGNFLAL